MIVPTIDIFVAKTPENVLVRYRMASRTIRL